MAWQTCGSPPGDPVRDLDVDAAGRLIATSLSGRFSSTDQGATWSPVVEATPATAPLPPPALPHAGPSELIATAREGAVIGSLVRCHWMSDYEAPGPGGMPITHFATRLSTYLDISVDGGATWSRTERSGATALALDRAGRVWLASHNGIDVADVRQAITGDEAAWRRALDRPATAVVVDRNDRVVVGTHDIALVSTDGATFEATAPNAADRGSWGSLECNAKGFTILRCAPDGRIWGVVGGVGGPHYIVRLSDDPSGKLRWDALALGLNVIARKGSRDGHIAVTALAFTPDGTAFAATTSQGLFRRL